MNGPGRFRSASPSREPPAYRERDFLFFAAHARQGDPRRDAPPGRRPTGADLAFGNRLSADEPHTPRPRQARGMRPVSPPPWNPEDSGNLDISVLEADPTDVVFSEDYFLPPLAPRAAPRVPASVLSAAETLQAMLNASVRAPVLVDAPRTEGGRCTFTLRSVMPDTIDIRRTNEDRTSFTIRIRSDGSRSVALYSQPAIAFR